MTFWPFNLQNAVCDRNFQELFGFNNYVKQIGLSAVELRQIMISAFSRPWPSSLTIQGQIRNRSTEGRTDRITDTDRPTRVAYKTVPNRPLLPGTGNNCMNILLIQTPLPTVTSLKAVSDGRPFLLTVTRGLLNGESSSFVSAKITFYRARQYTDARYWYSNSVRLCVRPSVCLSVCPSSSGILLYGNGLTYCHSFFTTR